MPPRTYSYQTFNSNVIQGQCSNGFCNQQPKVVYLPNTTRTIIQSSSSSLPDSFINNEGIRLYAHNTPNGKVYMHYPPGAKQDQFQTDTKSQAKETKAQTVSEDNSYDPNSKTMKVNGKVLDRYYQSSEGYRVYAHRDSRYSNGVIYKKEKPAYDQDDSNFDKKTGKPLSTQDTIKQTPKVNTEQVKPANKPPAIPSDIAGTPAPGVKTKGDEDKTTKKLKVDREAPPPTKEEIQEQERIAQEEQKQQRWNSGSYNDSRSNSNPRSRSYGGQVRYPQTGQTRTYGSSSSTSQDGYSNYLTLQPGYRTSSKIMTEKGGASFAVNNNSGRTITIQRKPNRYGDFDYRAAYWGEDRVNPGKQKLCYYNLSGEGKYGASFNHCTYNFKSDRYGEVSLQSRDDLRYSGYGPRQSVKDLEPDSDKIYLTPGKDSVSFLYPLKSGGHTSGQYTTANGKTYKVTNGSNNDFAYIVSRKQDDGSYKAFYATEDGKNEKPLFDDDGKPNRSIYSSQLEFELIAEKQAPKPIEDKQETDDTLPPPKPEPSKDVTDSSARKSIFDDLFGEQPQQKPTQEQLDEIQSWFGGDADKATKSKEKQGTDEVDLSNLDDAFDIKPKTKEKIEYDEQTQENFRDLFDDLDQILDQVPAKSETSEAPAKKPEITDPRLQGFIFDLDLEGLGTKPSTNFNGVLSPEFNSLLDQIPRLDPNPRIFELPPNAAEQILTLPFQAPRSFLDEALKPDTIFTPKEWNLEGLDLNFDFETYPKQ